VGGKDTTDEGLMIIVGLVVQDPKREPGGLQLADLSTLELQRLELDGPSSSLDHKLKIVRDLRRHCQGHAATVPRAFVSPALLRAAGSRPQPGRW
jgi:hypothetical protein